MTQEILINLCIHNIHNKDYNIPTNGYNMRYRDVKDYFGLVARVDMSSYLAIRLQMFYWVSVLLKIFNNSLIVA